MISISENELREWIAEGQKALAGDSNDAEHDALYSITESLATLLGGKSPGRAPKETQMRILHASAYTRLEMLALEIIGAHFIHNMTELSNKFHSRSIMPRVAGAIVARLRRYDLVEFLDGVWRLTVQGQRVQMTILMIDHVTKKAKPVRDAKDILDPNEDHGPDRSLCVITNSSGTEQITYHEDEIDEMPAWMAASADAVNELEDLDFDEFVNWLRDEDMLAPPEQPMAPCCPHCGSTQIAELHQWSAVSEADPMHSESLVEWQCRNEAGKCCKSFWL